MEGGHDDAVVALEPLFDRVRMQPLEGELGVGIAGDRDLESLALGTRGLLESLEVF